MATTPATISDTYPKLSYRYKVDFGGDTVGFSEVTGLYTGCDPVTYVDGVSAKVMPGKPHWVTLTLKRGTYKGNGALWDWIKTTNLNTVEKRDITISLLDEQGTEVVTWTVYDAFPHKLHAPHFNATGNEVAIESLELTAQRLEITYA